VGIYVNRTNHFRLSGNRLDKNSGSGIRHYEAQHGELQGDVVLNHFGMHSSGLNFYEGCADILFEGNYVHNTVAINCNAQRLVIRHNILYGLAEDIAGEIDDNIDTHAVEQRFMGPGCLVVTDPEVLFRDPTRGDYRRKPGGPALDAGASIPPPEGLNR
jgi:parallel beta-helix repeat protein